MYKKILAAITAAALLLTAIPAPAARAEEKQSKGTMDIQALPVTMEEKEAVSPYTIEKKDELTAENDKLALYVQKDSLIVKVKNKETGYIWSSAVPFDMTMGMSTEWQRISQSMLTMDFISKGSVKRSPLKHSEAKRPEVTSIENGFEAKVNFYEAKAKLTVKVVLTEDSIVVSIPDDSIEIKEGNLVNKIYVMPFFGASYQDTIPGYAFMPDGCGALMRFETSRPYATQYQQRIYGNDKSVSQPAAAKKSSMEAALESVRVPVFGMVHGNGQNAFAGIINSGAEYCELTANPAGNIVDYNWAGPAFLYNEQYWQPTGKTKGFYANQSAGNQVNLEVEYKLLSGKSADYVGMANVYKEKLIEKNPELSLNEAGNNVGLKLDAFMAEPKKALVGTKLNVMTKVSDVTDWVSELHDMGIKNISLSLTGFEKGGKNGHNAGSFSLDKKVGSSKEVEELASLLDDNLYFQSNFSTGYDNQFSSSQLKSGMNGATLQEEEKQPMFENRVWANEASIKKSLDSFQKNAPVKNLALEGLVTEINGDYQRGKSTQRSQVMEKINEMLNSIIESGSKVSLESPNFCALQAGDIQSVFAMPIENSKYIYFTDSVPFLQIVLSGYVDMYSRYQNFTTNTTEDVLKLIDYNMYPSYLLTEKASTELANSNMSYLYSSRFDAWKEDVAEHYKMINEILSQVTGSGISHRSVPVNGVSVTEYDNGVIIAVNYNEENAQVNGQTVPGMSAVTLEKEGAK